MNPTAASTPLLGIARLLGATFVAFELCALTGIAPGPHTALSLTEPNRFLAAAFAASFLLFARARPPRRELMICAGIAAALVAGTLFTAGPHPLATRVALIATGLGVGSLLALATRVIRASSDARPIALGALIPAAALPAFVMLTRTGLALTAALHPVTFDTTLYHLDAALGGQASFALGRLLASFKPLSILCQIAYLGLPLAIGLVYAAAEREKARGAELLAAILTAGAAGFALYHVCPVAGPRYLFDGLEGVFPDHAPDAASLPLTPTLLSPFDRNGIPSLHTAWALLLVFHSRPLGPKIRAFSTLFLALTLLSTLGLGEHYLVDLVVAVPFTVAVSAALSTRVSLARVERGGAFAAGVLFTLGWFLAIRVGSAWLTATRPLLWALVASSVVIPLGLHHRLARHLRSLDDAPAPAPVDLPSSPIPVESAALARRIAVVFFCSGFAGLVYEVVFGKSLGLTFGNTAQASAVVLATYMGGMALGAWAGGRFGAKRTDALRIYAYCELGIAAWCALSPLFFSGLRAAYVAIATGIAPGHPLLAVLQAALGALVILPATFLMGVTMPVLSRTLLRGDESLGWAIGMLYGANTLGAALGAFLTGYFLLPFFGVTYATWLAVALNLGVALAGLRLAASAPPPKVDSPAPADSSAPADSPAPGLASSAIERRLAMAILFGGGAITLALEVTYTHLLAVVAGNSAYAFSLMLFTFLIGLGLGAALMRRSLGGRPATLAVISAVELGLAAAILAGVFVWEAIPGYFASFNHYPSASHFGEREMIRFAVCCVAMIPPALFIGALYPAALECASRGHARGAVAAIGRASALNTAGNILGAVAGSFLLLPWLGSLRSLHLLAAFAILLGLLPLVRRAGRHLALAIPGLAALALFLVQPKTFDLSRLASGANVYFAAQSYGKVVDHAESTAGGLTTVAESTDADGTKVLTLLTNGKFQGDNSPNREMRAQYGIGLCPLLHTELREDALVIGYGVGGTARAMRDAGFGRTDVVELSDDVLRLATRHFARVNGHVLDDPSVHTYVTDGRNYLLLQERSYDVISLEISSIWFAGAASLYNQELYALARKRLRPGGVLQQWVQLHHMAQDDLVSVLATVRAEFPSAWVYFTGTQGVIIACMDGCAPTPATVSAVDRAPKLAEVVPLFDGSVKNLLKDLVLDPRGVDRLLRQWNASGGSVADLVSTDDNMRLEYTTPRGNVMSYAVSLQASLDFLSAYARPTPGEGAAGGSR